MFTLFNKLTLANFSFVVKFFLKWEIQSFGVDGR